VQTPFIEPYNTSVYAQYTIQVSNRDTLQQKLQAAGIPTTVHYPIPLNLQPVFAYLNQTKGCFPIAEEVALNVISLPMDSYLQIDAQEFIVKTLIQNVKNEKKIEA
jgi:UDP-2-acetamido-2-deoxy-ribo-hexuluronate aminotransferase